MNKNLKFTFFAFAVIAVSACVSLQPTATSARSGLGLTITDFSSSVAEIEGKNRNVRVFLEVENQGGYNTSAILPCLLGSNLGGAVSDQLWYNETKLCQPSSRSLLAADAAKGLSGGTLRSSWTLKSPWLPHPLSRIDTFTGRVYYLYKTKASATVWVYNEAEKTAAQQRGEAIPSALSVAETAGPVRLGLNSPQPVSYFAPGDTITLKITLSNVGGGTVFDSSGFAWDVTTPPSLVDKLNVVRLNYDSPSTLTRDSSCDTSVELKKGDTITISCDFRINNPVTTKQSFPITVSADYGYYIDKTLSVTAIGKRGESAT